LSTLWYDVACCGLRSAPPVCRWTARICAAGVAVVFLGAEANGWVGAESSWSPRLWGDRIRVAQGVRELDTRTAYEGGCAGQGAGRRRWRSTDPDSSPRWMRGDPVSRGDRSRRCGGTTKSTAKLAAELPAMGQSGVRADGAQDAQQAGSDEANSENAEAPRSGSGCAVRLSQHPSRAVPGPRGPGDSVDTRRRNLIAQTNQSCRSEGSAGSPRTVKVQIATSSGQVAPTGSTTSPPTTGLGQRRHRADTAVSREIDPPLVDHEGAIHIPFRKLLDHRRLCFSNGSFWAL